MRNTTNNKALNEAFSLVELMVIIGIIGVLAALGIPLANQAKDSSQRTRCLNNLRQLGVGATSYASEHNGWLPNMRYPYSYSWWPEAIAPYVQDYPWEQSLASSSPVFSCPAGSRQWPYNGWIPGVNYAYNARVGYIVNADASGATTIPVPLSSSYRARNMMACKFLSKTALIMDGDSQRIQFEYDQVADVENASLRHNGAANVLFVDGHVSLTDFSQMTPDEFRQLSLSGTYNAIW